MSKKTLTTITFLMLIGWIAGSSYYYLFKVRNNCGEQASLPERSEEILTSHSLDTISNIKEEVKPLILLNDGDITILEIEDNFHFSKGKSKILNSKEILQSLKPIKSFLENNDNKNLVITGLYSASDQEDKQLGIDRATSVANLLNSKMGINSNKLNSEAKEVETFDIQENTDLISNAIEYSISEVEKNAKKEPVKVNKTYYNKVKGKRVVYYGIGTFDPEVATLELEDYIRKLKLYFDQNPEGLVQLTGHSDSDQGIDESIAISYKRADQIKKYLIKEYNINPRNIRVNGKGDENRVDNSGSILAKAKNRRVEFKLIK